jgi:hypothetical protein
LSTVINETCHVAHSLFSERFGFARWLKHLTDGDPPGWAEIGRAVGRTGQAISGYSEEAEPPIDFRVHAALAEFLGVDERWIIRDEGQAPMPELWEVWISARRKRGAKQGRGIPAVRDASAGKKRA